MPVGVRRFSVVLYDVVGGDELVFTDTDTNVSETSQASSKQDLATTQQVNSVVQEILAQLGISSGTEGVKTKGSSSGFDAKIGFGKG